MKAIEMLTSDGDGLINFREFQIIYKEYPIVLQPAFKLQESMQLKTLGARAWLRVAEVCREVACRVAHY